MNSEVNMNEQFKMLNFWPTSKRSRHIAKLQKPTERVTFYVAFIVYCAIMWALLRPSFRT